MSVIPDKSIHQHSISHLYTPEIAEETDSQSLTKLLLEELHKGLYWQKQTLAEAAVEIQELLEKLEETHPTATEAEQKAFVTAAIGLTRKEQFLSALQSGWKEALQEFLDNPYLSIGIATLEEWKVAE